LIKAGVGATLKEGEPRLSLGKRQDDIKYARTVYLSPTAFSISVSKNEIRSCTDAHKDDFKQDAARDVLKFVYFEEKLITPMMKKAVKDAITELMKERVEYNENFRY
jgi:peptidyl-prolyl cis-trans isomerase D